MRKSMGEKLLLKVIDFASNIIDPYLCDIVVKDSEKNKYSEDPKAALMRPIFKRYERNNIGNYRPVSILNRMSKIYETCIHNSLSSYAEKMLSNFISPYRNSYSSNHVLLRLIEYWKKFLDKKIFWVLFLWISPRLLTVFFMTYLLQNCIFMGYQRMH